MKYFGLLFFLIVQFSIAQESTKINWVARIDEHEISAAELKYAFDKNRNSNENISLDSLKSFLNNYINFKLKVYEAYKRGIHSSTTLQTELDGYLKQLKRPYKEGADLESLAKEAYQRMEWEINASHLLISTPKNAQPKDTLAAYQKLDSLRKTINNQLEFEEAAKLFSQDGSASSGGQLGWFSAFSMVYPFEAAAYATKKGELSEIVRTQFGYHLLFVNDKRPERGRIKTSHIFFSNQLRSNADSEKLAQSVFDSLQNGKNWNTLVQKYSDDAQSKNKGGALPFASPGQLPEEFLNAAFQLHINEISQPVKSNYGWHIIRLDEKEPLPAFEKIKGQIIQQVERSGRNQLKELEVISKLKKQYNFSPNPAFDSLLMKLDSRVPYSELIKMANEKLFAIGRKNVLTKSLIEEKTKARLGTYRSIYPEFEKNQILAYADSIAPYDYPEYGFLRQEYKEGLLLFEIMQQEVWNKAAEDSLGQVAFYQNNKQLFTSPERIQYYEIENLKNNELVMVEKNLISMSSTEQEKWLEQSELKIAKKTIAITELTSFEGFNRVAGTVLKKDDQSLIVISNSIAAGYYRFEEIRGRVISDFQEELESVFVKKLRKQSTIKTNKKALKRLLGELD